MKKNTAIIFIFMILTAPGFGRKSSSPPGITAIPANDFLNSIGVLSAIDRRGENLQSTIDAVQYVGVRWIRSGMGIPPATQIELHKQTGVRFSYGLGSGNSDISRLLDGARQLAQAGILIGIEGNNEPNNWPVTYLGEEGGGSGTWIPLAKLQRDLYQAVKNDPVLKDYPVFSASEMGAQKDNVGLQFLTIPPGAGTLMPDGTKYADYANVHNYITHPKWPGLHDNQTWLSSDPTSACPVDGLHMNHGITWSKKFTGYSEPELLTLPRVTTETGVKIGEDGLTEELQARLFLNLYLSQFKRGWSYTSIYLLRDRSDEGGNQQYGFYKPDYTPRQAAHYLHNLTTILADKSSIKSPGTVNYAIPNQPETVHDMLLQKNDGTFCLVVWGERFAGGTDEITVNLGKKYRSVKIYNPITGISAVKTLKKVNSVQLTMSDHPIIIEF